VPNFVDGMADASFDAGGEYVGLLPIVATHFTA